MSYEAALEIHKFGQQYLSYELSDSHGGVEARRIQLRKKDM